MVDFDSLFSIVVSLIFDATLLSVKTGPSQIADRPPQQRQDGTSGTWRGVSQPLSEIETANNAKIQRLLNEGMVETAIISDQAPDQETVAEAITVASTPLQRVSYECG
jgi:hypothetical protein